MKLFRRLTGGGSSPSPKGTGGYFRYALGEIVLVVAGILIAVSINNWNEGRKTAAAVDQLLATVKADLLNDLAEIKTAEDFYEGRAPIFEKILAGEITADDYRANRPYAFLLIGYPEVSFDTRGFELLKDFKETLPADRRELAGEIIAFYVERQLEITVDDKLRADDFMANFTHFKETKSWWSAFIHDLEIEGFIPYALHDPDYRNRVATAHFIAYKVYLPELHVFAERAQALIAAIDKALAD